MTVNLTFLIRNSGSVPLCDSSFSWGSGDLYIRVRCLLGPLAGGDLYIRVRCLLCPLAGVR